MTSIFEGQPPKTRPWNQSKQGTFGFQEYIGTISTFRDLLWKLHCLTLLVISNLPSNLPSLTVCGEKKIENPNLQGFYVVRKPEFFVGVGKWFVQLNGWLKRKNRSFRFDKCLFTSRSE